MKQKRYWLSGGTVSSVIGIVFLLLIYATKSELIFSFPLIILSFPFFIGGITSWAFLDLGFQNSTWELSTLGTILNFTLVILIYFLIGAFLGWLYGKIKNRNEVI